MYKICTITTNPGTVKEFFEERIPFLQKHGFEVTIITSPDEKLSRSLPATVKYVPVEFLGRPSAIHNIACLFKLYKILRKGKFDIVQYTGPKAALLGSIASFFAGIPVRLYLMWGIYYIAQTGFTRTMFRMSEKLVCAFSTDIAADSFSNRRLAVEEGLCRTAKIDVVGNGSANGVDMTLFNPNRLAGKRISLRKKLGITDDTTVFGCIAPIARDKGINELVEAFCRISKIYPKTLLLLVGNPDEKNAVSDITMKEIDENPYIKSLNWQEGDQTIMSAMDIFVLPTYGEGFEMVNIESGAMGLPVISTNVPGPQESIANGKTGLLVPPARVEPLFKAMRMLIEKPELKYQLGIAARKKVQQRYERSIVWNAIIRHRINLLRKAGVIRDIPVKKKPSICVVATISLSIKQFYAGQLKALNNAGFNTIVICSRDTQMRRLLPLKTFYIPVKLTRTYTVFADLMALFRLYRIFSRENFDIVQYSTPKASLLGSIAAFFAGVHNRIYFLWGLYYTAQSGVKRKIFKSIEKIICSLSTHVISVSHDMVNFAVSEGLARAQKCTCLLSGSANGVDTQRFDPKNWPDARAEIRDKYNIPRQAVVIGTVARLTTDKGINELVGAFEELAKEFDNLYLLIVGRQEEKDRLLPQTEEAIHTNPRIFLTGWQNDSAPYYTAMDIFCLPTYREGFGEVNLEAQAMALPVVSTDIMGPRESVADGRTGFLVEPRSTKALIEPLRKLIVDPQLRKNIGEKGRTRIETEFNRKDMIQEIIRYRLALLRKMPSNIPDDEFKS